MGEAFFYHLTATPLEVTLPMLLEKSRAAGWQVFVRGTSEARLKWLDERLWTQPEDGFLPHGVAGGAQDAEQPVLLGMGDVANGAQCLLAVDGAVVSAEEVGTYERVLVLFDGNDEAAKDVARGQWKVLTEAGCKTQYWAQDDGKWVKKAES